MKFFIVAISMLIPLSTSIYGAPNYPFPTHNTYTAGVIKPTNVSQAQMDAKVQQLYNQWKQIFIVTSPNDSNQSYVSYNQDRFSFPADSVCVSEAQGYGMLITVFMAGFDPQAQVIFDKLYNYYKAFPSRTPHLMGWQQVLKDGKIIPQPNSGMNSATDGDLDIGFALLLADKQWGSNGTINYLKEAQAIIEDTMKADINQEIWTIKLGDWVHNNNEKYGKGTRTSDFMLNHFRNFATVSKDVRWTSVLNKTYSIINELFRLHPTRETGLLPDFAHYSQSSNSFLPVPPAPPNYLETPNDNKYNWNASRTPWRIATDYILSGDPRALDQLNQLNQWIRQTTKGDPSQIKAGHTLEGTPLQSYSSTAFSTPFAVSAMINAENQAWLNSLWTYTSSQQTNTIYYGNTIRLLCLIMVSGNWWTPLNLPAD